VELNGKYGMWSAEEFQVCKMVVYATCTATLAGEDGNGRVGRAPTLISVHKKTPLAIHGARSVVRMAASWTNTSGRHLIRCSAMEHPT
jgi:hypothetical protein